MMKIFEGHATVHCECICNWSEPFEGFIPEYLRVELAKFEEDRLLSSWIVAGFNYFSQEEIDKLIKIYTKMLKKAKKLAQRNLQCFVALEARSQFLCWDVIKRLRSTHSSVDIDSNLLIARFSDTYFTNLEPIIFSNPQVPFDLSSSNDLQFIDDELVQALNSLNGNASTGSDRIPS